LSLLTGWGPWGTFGLVTSTKHVQHDMNTTLNKGT